jgi:hypothetical protein
MTCSDIERIHEAGLITAEQRQRILEHFIIFACLPAALAWSSAVWYSMDSPMTINIYAAWIGFLMGCVAGAVTGLFFHGEGWLGGYSSWQRRMIRLGHIAFFGIGVINLSFALTARALGLDAGLQSISILLIVGAVTMPAVCYLSAWKPAFRNVFFIPAMSLSVGIALFVWRIIKL